VVLQGPSSLLIASPGMRVLTWNMGFWQRRAEHDHAIRYLFDELNPDVALLQEVRRPRSDDARFVFVSARSDWGTAIYLRSGLDPHPLPLSVDVPGRPGRAAGALVRLPSGREIAFVSVHVPIVSGRVIPSARSIFGALCPDLRGRSFIVGGDLNTARSAEGYWPGYGHRDFWQWLDASIFRDCHRLLNLDEQPTFRHPKMRRPIQDDHLLVSASLCESVRSCVVHQSDEIDGLSDHSPVVAELDFR
jgi:endonuclease/exonuclease/phosphatase family metal-dependent hydrolase